LEAGNLIAQTNNGLKHVLSVGNLVVASLFEVLDLSGVVIVKVFKNIVGLLAIICTCCCL
jgi:hypothetical protein